MQRRFTWAIKVPWSQATRAEARDFCRWLQLAGKPGRPGAAKTLPGKRPPSARFATSPTASSNTAPAPTAIHWHAAITALNSGGLPCSEANRILQLAVSLRDTVSDLDDHNIARLLTAIRHATGELITLP